MEERCDQIMDCEDKSDENNCNLIVFEKVPPFTIMKKDHVLIPARVNVSTHLKNHDGAEVSAVYFYFRIFTRCDPIFIR